MPQARRKTPFSGKAKKQQLQGKKQNKTLLMSTGGGTTECDVVSVNYQPARGRGGGRDTNRYALKFYRETEDELRMKKEDAQKELRPVPEKAMEVTPEEYFPTEMSFPKRPPWDFNMTPAQLDAQEQRYFKNYVDNLQASEHWKQMSYFELNLETWRQLWRVLEMCDVLLLIVDVRYAGMMLPPSLYSYIREQNKDMILVLNKIDLVSASVVAAWKEYLTEAYPGLRVLYFTSCPAYNLRGATSDKAGLQVRRRKGKQRMCAEGATKILEACKEIVKGEVDLSSWEKKIKEETNVEFDYEEGAEVGETILEKADTSYYTHERYKSGVLTIGCVGQPNVGKSSLLNALMGRCVVSVSRTPGHTKHFQTIFLTPQVRLCDCPGLVFPSTVPRPIQILMGSYPIAQLREPYTTIRYLAERMDLPKLLRIDHPEGDESWSPRDICDGWAKKRSYLTAKAARLDTYRAANSLLRMALDGRICLWLRPPGFTENKDKCTKTLPLKISKELLTMPWWSEELAQMKKLVATKRRRIRVAAPVRRDLVVSRYLEEKEKFETALKKAHEGSCKGFCEKYETCEEIKYVRWVQALSDTKSDDVLTSESDNDRRSDGDDNSGSSDDEETTAMANKFAALAGDGEE